MRRQQVGVVLGVVAVGLVGIGVLWFFSARGHVAVIDAQLVEPGVVHLSVASCLAEPEATVTDEDDGRYRVEVRTTQSWDRGQDCADQVEISVDPTLDSLEIIDTKRGTVFPLPPPPQPPPMDPK